MNNQEERKSVDGYGENEIHLVYDLAAPKSWDDVINFLVLKNENFTEGKEDLMINDFGILKEKKVPFEPDPAETLKLIRGEEK
jgi:hypothetical protein